MWGRKVSLLHLLVSLHARRWLVILRRCHFPLALGDIGYPHCKLGHMLPGWMNVIQEIYILRGKGQQRKSARSDCHTVMVKLQPSFSLTNFSCPIRSKALGMMPLSKSYLSGSDRSVSPIIVCVFPEPSNIVILRCEEVNYGKKYYFCYGIIILLTSLPIAKDRRIVPVNGRSNKVIDLDKNFFLTRFPSEDFCDFKCLPVGLTTLTFIFASFSFHTG